MPGRRSSFLHTPSARFSFLCPELCSKLLVPSFAPVPFPISSPNLRLWAWLCLFPSLQLFPSGWTETSSLGPFCLFLCPSLCSPPVHPPPLAGWLGLAGWFLMLSLSSSHACISFPLSLILSSGLCGLINPLLVFVSQSSLSVLPVCPPAPCFFPSFPFVSCPFASCGPHLHPHLFLASRHHYYICPPVCSLSPPPLCLHCGPLPAPPPLLRRGLLSPSPTSHSLFFQ